MVYEQLGQLFLHHKNKWYSEPILIFLISCCFFITSSDAPFYVIWSNTETINAIFTLWMVMSSWWLFKRFNRWFFTISPSKIVGIISSVSALILYVILANWIYIEVLWREQLINTLFFVAVLPMAVITFLLWNLGFIFSQNLSNSSKVDKLTLDKSHLEHLIVKIGKQKIVLPISKIAFFYIEERYIYAYTFNDHKYLIEQNLNALEKQLNQSCFFRLNRQVIISKRAVISYKTDKNQKILVDFVGISKSGNNGIASRYKAPEFKVWIET